MMNLTYNICRCTQLRIVVAPLVSAAGLTGQVCPGFKGTIL